MMGWIPSVPRSGKTFAEELARWGTFGVVVFGSLAWSSGELWLLLLIPVAIHAAWLRSR